jgi:hypothetical protein
MEMFRANKIGKWQPECDLDKYGDDGWELAGVVPLRSKMVGNTTSTTVLMWVFKRHKA